MVTKKLYTYPIFLMFFSLLITINACHQSDANYTSLEDYPVYSGTDLGLKYSPESSTFKIWSPTAEAVKLRLYKNGIGGNPILEKNLTRSKKGTWSITISQDLKGQFYTFQILQNDEWLNEVPDPYVKATGINGHRGMVIDWKDTNPEGWTNNKSPVLKSPNNIILYELQIRDFSIHPNAGIQYKGQFLGLAETGTKNPEGKATGLDHIKEMGVTHVHILPAFDFMYLDETKLDEKPYNWGYAPQNFNVPEGSFSTNPYDGAVRIREFKQMVKALHDNGLRVILDVVYNHTGATENSNFNQLVPQYYYRQNPEGGFSNASACGNEMASERPMMRKFMLESLQYWVKAYHIDGFRFDLMGVHDIETMNEISETLHQIDSTIFLYGEGWTAGDSPLPKTQQALKQNTHHLKDIAAFSDDMRDALKGHVFKHEDKGFVSGKSGLKESIKFGIVAATPHPQINYDSVTYSDAAWATKPAQCINYVSCHDNHTLWDKLQLSNPDASETERINMQRLANMIVLTSQGIPFLHAGVELLRTKKGVENSFESPDSINQIDWSRKALYQDNIDYYKGLIQLRKQHPAFRMPTAEMIRKHLRFWNISDEQVIAYTIDNHANGDEWKTIMVILNGHAETTKLLIPKGNWTVVVNGDQVNETGIEFLKNRDWVNVEGSTGMMLVSRE